MVEGRNRALLLVCLLCLFCGAGLAAQKVDVVQALEQVAALIRDNKLSDAERELTAILKISPDLPVALNFMGTVLAKQGRLNEAELLFLRAVRNDKKFAAARMNLVYLYQLKRTPDKAVVQLEEVVALEAREC